MTCITCLDSTPPVPCPPTHKMWTDHPFTSIVPIVSGSLSGALLIFLLLFVCLRFRRTRQNRRINGRPTPPVFVERDNLNNDERMLEIDHPIWHIRTVGLQESLIESIPLFKYKKGEGVVESTDCAICLTEFEESESLRLLPKCSHAFHLPCIDMWLKSHQNCPVCRAPVAAATKDSQSPTAANPSADGSHVITIGSSSGSTVRSDEEFSEGHEESEDALHNEQMSSYSAENALDGGDQLGAEKAERGRAKGKVRENRRISDSLSFRNLLGTSLGNQSSQVLPTSVVRSFSSSGKLGV